MSGRNRSTAVSAAIVTTAPAGAVQRRVPFVLAVAVAGGLCAAGAPLAAQDAAAFAPLVTIKEIMEKTITPATNTLWGAYEPPAEDAWPVLEEAAVTLLVAAAVTAQGGAGPMDAEWVKQPAWVAFNRAMTDAARDALAAIRARDHAALLAAGDALYPPCEGCHTLFNPGVVNAQQ